MTIAQRRQKEWNDTQPVEQVLAKVTVDHRGTQRTMRRRHDPDVDREWLATTDRDHGALLQHPKELRLQVETELGDLVEKERAAFGQAEVTRHVTHRSSERPFDVPEELALEKIGRQRRAVDRAERFRSHALTHRESRAPPAPCPFPSRRGSTR